MEWRNPGAKAGGLPGGYVAVSVIAVYRPGEAHSGMMVLAAPQMFRKAAVKVPARLLEG
jgi:hypothetical protein